MPDPNFAPGKKAKFWIFFSLTLLAAIFRIAFYLSNHSLVHDEAAVAVNLIHRSYADLRKPLDFWVVAPIGFLYIEKFLGQSLGYSELSLRLFPLIAGLALVPAYLLIADNLFNWPTAIIGALLLGTEHRLIEWSARLKPYGLDALLALITIYIICQGIRRGWSLRYLLLAALWGAFAQWFSFPMILLLAGMGSVAIIHAITQKKWRNILALILICIIWLASFILDRSFAMNIGSTKGHVDFLWDQYFMPHSWHAIPWIPWAITMIFSQTIRLGPWPGFPLIALIASLMILPRRPGWPVLLAIAPIIPAFLAAALNKYPFGDRVLLYFVPLVVLVMSAGLAELLENPRTMLRLIAGLLFLIMIIPDLGLASFRMFHEPSRDDTRPVYSYILAHHQPADTVYVSFFAIPSYQYYAPRLGLNRLPAQLGSGTDTSQLQDDLSQLSGRVWMVSDLLNVDTTYKSFRQLLQLAHQRGPELDHINIAHVEAHLFDLR